MFEELGGCRHYLHLTRYKPSKTTVNRVLGKVIAITVFVFIKVKICNIWRLAINETGMLSTYVYLNLSRTARYYCSRNGQSSGEKNKTLRRMIILITKLRFYRFFVYLIIIINNNCAPILYRYAIVFYSNILYLILCLIVAFIKLLISTQGNILFVAHHSVQLTGTNKSVILTLIMCDNPAPSSELLGEIQGNIDKSNIIVLI